MSFDPFPLNIIQEHLRAVSDEMFVRLGQASKSPRVLPVYYLSPCSRSWRNSAWKR
jgi:hypothetical protein